MGLKQSVSELLNLNELKNDILKLIEAKVELKKLEVQEKAESVVAELALQVVLLLVGSILLVFVLQVLAYALDQWLGEPYGLYIITTLVCAFFVGLIVQKDWFKSQLQAIIQKKIDARIEEKTEA